MIHFKYICNPIPCTPLLFRCKDMFNHQFSNGTGTRCWVAAYNLTDEAMDINSNAKIFLRKVHIPVFNDKATIFLPLRI